LSRPQTVQREVGLRQREGLDHVPDPGARRQGEELLGIGPGQVGRALICPKRWPIGR
jgi:hypothetical protein